MDELTIEDMPLPALFEQARKIHLTATEPGVDQDLVRKGCEMLQKCEDMIGKLGLFSANETKDDISTAHLKYLLVPFFLAELTEKVKQDNWIQILNAFRTKLKEFISLCEAMELVPDDELEALTRGGANAPADRRALKIARFKRQRAAESKLLEIMERRATKASALSAPVEAGEEDVPDDDSEEEREAWLTTVSLALCKALDMFEMLN